MKKFSLLIFLVGLLFLLPSSALARNVMFGFSGGGGFVAGVSPGSTGILLYPPITYKITLPAFEVRFLRDDGTSVDLQLHIGNLLHGAIFGAAYGTVGSLLLPIQIGVYHNYRIGSGTRKFIVAPGAHLELLLNSSRSNFTWLLSVQPGIRLGVETSISKNILFEFRGLVFLAVGLAIGGFEMPPFLFGGGVIAEMAFYFG